MDLLTDSDLSAQMEAVGTLPPKVRHLTAKVNGHDLPLALDKLRVQLRPLHWEGYDPALLVLVLRRDDRFAERGPDRVLPGRRRGA